MILPHCYPAGLQVKTGAGCSCCRDKIIFYVPGVTTSEKGFKHGNLMAISYEDFHALVLYVMTNTNLSGPGLDDPRMSLLVRMRGLKGVLGYNKTGLRFQETPL
jgi:hypothetical protein